MKKTIILLIVMMLVVSACGTKTENSNKAKEEQTSQSTQNENKVEESGEKEYKIGIIQIAEHSALDANREGFIKSLEDAGINASIDYKNAQGDVNNALRIAKKFVDDKVDLIFAIATPSAQAAKQATKDTDIPVIFSAVTDPVAAGLVENMESNQANITGTSDKAPIKLQLQIFSQLNPEIKKVGVMYNTGETNSEVQLQEVEALAPEVGLEIVPVGITTVNDIPKGLESLIAKTDAMYALTDNLVASSLELISHTALEQKYIIVQSYIDNSEAAEGILVSNGFSYYDLGVQTGNMAKQILSGEKKAGELPIGMIEKTENVVSKKALDAIGIDPELEIIKKAKIQ